MQLRDRYPVDAVGGSCFISLRYEVAPGERIIDLDRVVDEMPLWGRLCVSEEGVRQLNTILGWTVDNKANEKIKELRAINTDLRHEIAQYRTAMETMITAAKEAGIDVLAMLEPVEA